MIFKFFVCNNLVTRVLMLAKEAPTFIFICVITFIQMKKE